MATTKEITMRQDLAFASIRQGNLSAADGWRLVSSLVTTKDQAVAERLCDALRAWTWRALDRRRRDDGLREWIDLLNKVEGFLVDRFAFLAAKIETLAELLHESLTVARFADPETLLRRKRVVPILQALECHEGEWLDRSGLMQDMDLKPANTTRLMSLLADVGWVEQEITGREAKYRITTEGLLQIRSVKTDPLMMVDVRRPEVKVWQAVFEKGLFAHDGIGQFQPAMIAVDRHPIRFAGAKLREHDSADDPISLANRMEDVDHGYPFPSSSAQPMLMSVNG